MTQKSSIEAYANKSKMDRKLESLESVWVANNSVSHSIVNEPPFYFTGVNSTIPSVISDIIDSCKNRLFYLDIKFFLIL